MNTPITTEEKMAVATTYVKKMRKLAIIRFSIAAILILVFYNMKKLSRIGFTELSLGLFMICGLALAGLSIYSQANLYCPFCGERFGYWTSKLEILPGECPKCGERIKY